MDHRSFAGNLGTLWEFFDPTSSEPRSARVNSHEPDVPPDLPLPPDLPEPPDLPDDPPPGPVFGSEDSDKLNGTRGQDIVSGLAGKDRISGRGADDLLDGGAGNDRIKGGGGDDLIIGGRGRDTLVGGRGADVFVFDTEHKHDTIKSFQRSDDLYIFVSGGDFLGVERRDVEIVSRGKYDKIYVDGDLVAKVDGFEVTMDSIFLI